MRVKKWTSFILRNLGYLLISLSIGLIISFLFGGIYIFQNLGVLLRTSVYGIIIGLSLWKSNELYSTLIRRQFNWSSKPGVTLFMDMLGTVFVSLVVIFIVNYFFIFLISPHSFGENPRLFILIGIIQLFISFSISSVFYIQRFFRAWRTLVISEEQLKRDTISLQYDALKSNRF